MIVTLPQLFNQQTGMALVDVFVVRTHFFHILIESIAAASAKGNRRRFAVFCGLAGSLRACVRGLTGILRKNPRLLMRRCPFMLGLTSQSLRLAMSAALANGCLWSLGKFSHVLCHFKP